MLKVIYFNVIKLMKVIIKKFHLRQNHQIYSKMLKKICENEV